ncbi:unnamed protein product [Effrenium voratum]|uniref:Uncharacterized protein n=1 Tax=Effrenium voratum TaxID=2562239 RepID=A0AA36NK37_9DINO|nr:unnamed protein product [Effrenium voratum]CAJ1405458.1 unnamed protein product [Effrenium voratum]
MVALSDTEGKKSGLEKAKILAKALDDFAGGSEEVKNILKSRIVSFTSDGERAEPLGARLAKEQGTLPGLLACMRCRVHALVRSLENALASDSRVERLISSLITGYSGGHGEPGGFGRAMKNSPRLACKLREQQVAALHQLDGAMSKLTSFRFCPQRFNTIMEVSEMIVLNVQAIFQLLVELRASGDQVAQWAQRLLSETFTSKNLLLLALVTELSSAAVRFAHKFDGVKEPTHRSSRLARTGGWLALFKQEVNKLFSFRDDAGSLQEPLVLAAAYDAGYVQLLQKQWNFLSTSSLISSTGELLHHKQGTGSTARLRSFVSAEIGTIANIANVLVQAIETECDTPIQCALAPFDIAHWTAARSDDALL